MTAKGCASVVRTAVLAATLGGGIEAIDLELSQAEMEEVLTIAQVVEEVAGARHRAEGEEDRDGVEDSGALVDLPREQQAGEDKQVLDPLGRAHGPDERWHGGEG